MDHVFISYVRENEAEVRNICAHLEASGVEYWLDRESIEPGADWREAIRSAIANGAFFLACFSPQYYERSQTHMNEELSLAVDCIRQRPHGATWFIPARLSECPPPSCPIGGARDLSDFQCLDFYPDFGRGLALLAELLERNSTGGETGGATEDQRRQLWLDYLGAKALLDSGSGEFFHNSDPGHPVYRAGALGHTSDMWDYADGPDKNLLFKRLSALSQELLAGGEASGDPDFVDFSDWSAFCRYAHDRYLAERRWGTL